MWPPPPGFFELGPSSRALIWQTAARFRGSGVHRVLCGDWKGQSFHICKPVKTAQTTRHFVSGVQARVSCCDYRNIRNFRFADEQKQHNRLDFCSGTRFRSIQAADFGDKIRNLWPLGAGQISKQKSDFQNRRFSKSSISKKRLLPERSRLIQGPDFGKRSHFDVFWACLRKVAEMTENTVAPGGKTGG